jgi:hypothetical protein
VNEGFPPSDQQLTPPPARAEGHAGSVHEPARAHAHTADDARFPWPPGENDSIADAVWRTWRGSALHPSAFFRAMPERAPMGPALLYYLPLGVVVAGVDLFWRLVLGPVEFARGSALGRIFASSPTNPLVDFLLSPVVMLLVLIVGAAITHVALAVLGGARHGFGTTVRVFCFGYSPAILAVIPRAGVFVAAVWSLVISIIGLREAHRTTGLRAAMAIIAPVLLLLGFFVFIVLLVLSGALLEAGS